MTSLLPGKSKTNSQENSFKALPMNWPDLGHFQTPTAVECFSIANQEGLTHLPFLN
jgi:hypothetical protein